MTTNWNPETYEQFADLRSRPFHDLVSMVGPTVEHPHIADLGCGTGRLTATLVGRFDAGSVVGIDSSPHMLTTAAGLDLDDVTASRLRFESGDIATFDRPGAYDVIVSNAALQWTDDHRATLARWSAGLRPGGQLAVQLPSNFDHPSHQVAYGVAAHAYFADRWTTGEVPVVRSDHMLTPGGYAELLFELGFVEQSVVMRVYPMIMDSTAAVLDWTRGTLLALYRSTLSVGDYAEFERRYLEALLAEVGDHSPYFYGFDRILFWGRRP